MEVGTINWEHSSWKYLSLVGLLHKKVYVFSDSVLCLGKMNENPQSNYAWEERLAWFKSSQEYRNLDRIDGEPMEFKWNIFPGFTTLQLCQQSPRVHEQNGRPNTIPRTDYLHVYVQDIIWGSEDNERECIANATLVTLFAKRFPAGRWSFFGPGSEKMWYSTYIDRPQKEWDRVAELMMIKFRETGHPVFRATSPLSRGTLKSRGGGKLLIHFCADGDTIETVFRTIISVNQLSICGAVSDLCHEYSACQARTGRLVLAEQSDPLFRVSRLVDNDTYTFD